MSARAYVPAPGVQAPVLPPGKLELKYLFCAQFADGTVYEQGPEDESPFTPGRNSFYELLDCDEQGNPRQDDLGRLITRSDIRLFQLESADFRYLVDLRDGHFEVQHHALKKRGKEELLGAHFWLAFPRPGAKLQLFYFRRRRHHQNCTVTVQDDQTLAFSPTTETQECEYRFGWETEDRAQKAELILI